MRVKEEDAETYSYLAENGRLAGLDIHIQNHKNSLVRMNEFKPGQGVEERA